MIKLLKKGLSLFRKRKQTSDVQVRPPMVTPIPAKNSKVRQFILDVEKKLDKQPNAVYGDNGAPLKHSFGDGLYVREIFLPKGMLLTSAIHKFEHPYFILKGDVTVLTEEGVVRIKAPFQGMTPPGTKRLIQVHEDTIWITVHATDERDVVKARAELTARDFSEIPAREETKELIKGEIQCHS